MFTFNIQCNKCTVFQNFMQIYIKIYWQYENFNGLPRQYM